MAAGDTALKRRRSAPAHRRPSHRRAVSQTSALPPAAEDRFLNRDESWLEFNQRVVEEADDAGNPLLERVKFLAITASNLDEFFEIRVAGVLQQIEENLDLPQVADESGLTPTALLERLRKHLHAFQREQTSSWTERLAPALDATGIRLVRWKQLTRPDREFATRFFEQQVDPLLTPVTIDPSHPFPRVLNKAICLALLLRLKRRGRSKVPSTLGVVTIPRSLPTLLALPQRNGRRDFLLLDELIEAHADRMFRGYRVLGLAAFRVTRNSNLYLEEEESRSVLESVREELHNRRKGDVVRLEIAADAAEEIVERLSTNFELDPWQIFPTEAPVNLSRLMDLYTALNLPDLKFPEFHGRRLRLSKDARDIFDEIRKRDILLHHPFDSYSAVESFIESSATDPSVVSIKQTLYRTSADSPIFGALKEAAQSKDVMVVVELMARFDEASNIRWARELEDSGVQVSHGIYGSKTHCKLALLVRHDPDGQLRSYAHLGTGNYNPTTARFYTDVSLLTCRPELTSAVLRVFRYLTAEWETDAETFRPLEVAPITLAADTLALIHREAEHARAGRPARLIAKMNALVDPKTIDALYAASQAGVEIDLIVRGMCTLRPGIAGLSDRIRVRSIVGRFLEHTRIFWFANGGEPEVFSGSADWMPRNLYERCEVVFPVVDEASARRLRDEILEAYLRDNVKARLMQPNGSYTRPSRRGPGLSAQDWLMQRAHEAGPREVQASSPAITPN
ncbi:MAG TPA: polyphosphate kinase 1 [Acidobacteriaceae bacterium]|jgi:polyphosphate kinase|nr:polyphosphate kinase 1 [Acidobacteriaceae bacterium]